MPISLVCNCGKRLRVADELKGKKVRCPGCKALLTAGESAAPSPPAPAVTTKATAPEAPPASEPPEEAAATAKAPKPKKSKAKTFLLVGCGCLGLVGTGVAVLVIAIIVSVATRKEPKDKLLGQWVLDQEATQKSAPGVLAKYKTIRYDFRKNDACTIQINDETSEGTWGVLEQAKDELKIKQFRPNQGIAVVVIKFQDNDHLEIDFPLACRLRRAGADEGTKGPTSPSSPAADDKAPRLLAGHKKGVGALAFAADNKRLVSAGLDGTAIVWDVPTATAKHTLREPSKGKSAVVTPDGKTVITGGGSFADGGAFTAWDADSGQIKRPLHKQKNYPAKMASSPDGKLAAWDDGTWVILWDVAAASVRTTFKDLGGIARGLAFSRDSKKLAGCDSSGHVRVWDVGQPNGPSVTTTLKESLCLAWSPEGVLAVGGEDKKLTLWSPGTNKVRHVFPSFPDAVRDVAFSPDGKVLAATSRDTIFCYDPSDHRELGRWKSTSIRDNQLGALAFSPDGKTLAVGSNEATSGGIFLLAVAALVKPKP